MRVTAPTLPMTGAATQALEESVSVTASVTALLPFTAEDVVDDDDDAEESVKSDIWNCCSRLAPAITRPRIRRNVCFPTRILVPVPRAAQPLFGPGTGRMPAEASRERLGREYSSTAFDRKMQVSPACVGESAFCWKIWMPKSSILQKTMNSCRFPTLVPLPLGQGKRLLLHSPPWRGKTPGRGIVTSWSAAREEEFSRTQLYGVPPDNDEVDRMSTQKNSTRLHFLFALNHPL
ncbi:hypothetical protein F4779DRAFT_618491 [Xylariaceae sp. FL0662B]|nr:hypothetical protein F4779DRAFT_618491 [Xylariaceae sp. FL0662B]